MQSATKSSSSENVSAPAAKKRGWWGRNWLRLFLSLVILAIVAAGGGYLYRFGPLLFSAPYRQTMAELQKSPQVKKLLGEPVRAGWFPVGGVNKEEGSARMYLKVHGPKTADGSEPKADVAVQARCVDGKWDFTQFDVQPEGGPRVNLLDEIAPPSDVAPIRCRCAATAAIEERDHTAPQRQHFAPRHAGG